MRPRVYSHPSQEEGERGVADGEDEWVAVRHFVALHVDQSINYVSAATVPVGKLDRTLTPYMLASKLK